jgi:aryl-alcohol dehydrogenase-like predicted oxidoreductase
METRPFGKTGESFPILSFGAQRIVDEEGCNEDQALEILNTALERGIRYFDTAGMRCGSPPRRGIRPAMARAASSRRA